MNDLYSQAFTYGLCGLRIFPCKPGGKTPLIKDWPNKATYDLRQIGEWWDKEPNANIGLVTGSANNIVVIDIDPKNGGSLDNIDFSNAVMVATGGGGWHLYFKHDPLFTTGTSVFGDGIDVRAEGGYVIAPDSIHESGNAYEFINGFDIDDLGKLNPAPAALLDTLVERAFKAADTVVTGVRATEGAIAEFNEKYTPGEILARNGYKLHPCGKYLRPGSTSGVPGVTVYPSGKILSRGADSLNDGHSHDAFDVYRILECGGDWAVAMAWNKPKEEKPRRPGRLTVITGEDLVAGFAPPDWLIEDWISRDEVAVMYGASGSGKSFVALDWAAHIAIGRKWHGLGVVPGLVMYVANEGRGGMRGRLFAWAMEHNRKAPPVVFPTEQIRLGNSQDLRGRDSIVSTMKDLEDETGKKTAMVIIDTLAGTLDGDENSGQCMGEYVSQIQDIQGRLQCAVLTIHHSGWAQQGKELRMRGHSSLVCAVDHEYRVEKDPEDGLRKLVCTKSKDAPPAEDMYFRLKSIDLGHPSKFGKATTSCVLIKGEKTTDKAF